MQLIWHERTSRQWLSCQRLQMLQCLRPPHEAPHELCWVLVTVEASGLCQVCAEFHLFGGGYRLHGQSGLISQHSYCTANSARSWRSAPTLEVYAGTLVLSRAHVQEREEKQDPRSVQVGTTNQVSRSARCAGPVHGGCGPGQA